MYLFFDTETTGIPRNYKAPVSDLQNWPRLVQIAWLLADEEANEVTCAEYIVKPDGFIIPQDAAEVHGITTEMAIKNGVDLKIILNEVKSNIEKALVLVAHNIQFDEKILGAELFRANYPTLIDSKERRCTMQSATNYCRLPGPYGYKWPKLQELHVKLFGKTFEGAHSALSDVRACARCYFELRRMKIMA
jgi:DNA polymerase III epsilon subunit-like protein